MIKSLLSCVFILALLSQGTTAAQGQLTVSWEQVREPSVGGRVTSLSVSPHDASRVLIGGDVLGIGLSTDGGESWGSTFGLQNWEISQFTWHPTDPDTVWAGTLGGPYVSYDAGRNWTPQRAGMPPIEPFDYAAPVEKVLFDPNDANRLVALGGSSRRQSVDGDSLFGAVWTSNDAGASWNYLTTLFGSGSSNARPLDRGENIVGATFLAGSSNTLLLAADGRGVLRTFDLAGGTFATSNAGLPHTNVERLVADHSNPDRAYVSLASFDDGGAILPGGVYVTNDGGLSWTDAGTGLDQVVGPTELTTSRYQAFAGDAQDGTRLVAADDRFGTNGVFVSNDGGQSWNNTLSRELIDLPYPSDVEFEVAEVAASDRDLIFLAGSANLVRSNDGGQTWTDSANIAHGDGAYSGRGYSGLIGRKITFNPWDPDHVLLQGFDAARVIQTRDGGQTWTFEAAGDRDFQGGADASFASADIAYASLGFQNTYEGVARTTDGGDSWDIVAGSAVGLPAIGTRVDAGGIIASTADPLRAWTIVGGDLYRTSNGGDAWTLTAPSIGDGWFAFAPDESTLYVSGEDAVYRSTDGINFSSIDGPGESGRLVTGADGSLYLASHSGTGRPGNGLWVYTDDAGWIGVLTPDTAATNELKTAAEFITGVAVNPLDPEILVATTSDPPFRDISRASGVLISLDGGGTWSFINEQLPLLRGDAVAFNPHDPYELWLGTGGRGFYATRLEGILIPEPTCTIILAAAFLIRRRSRNLVR
jgi:hypothetical protein